MNKKAAFVVIIALAVLGIFVISSAFAGSTVSFAVGCYMPAYITTSSGAKVLSTDKDNAIAAEIRKEPQVNEEKKEIFIQKIEENITSEQSSERTITIFAK